MTTTPAPSTGASLLTGSAVGPFPTGFKYGAPEDVRVWLELAGVRQPDLTLASDYTLTGATPLVGGGTITLSGALVPAESWNAGAGDRLVWARRTVKRQALALPDAEGHRPRATEQGLDKLMRAAEEQGDALSLAVTVPVGETGFQLPRLVDRAEGVLIYDEVGAFDVVPASPGEFLGWGAMGKPVALTGTGADAGLRVDLAAGPGDALVKTQMDGGVARSVGDKLGDLPTVNDFADPEAEAIEAFALPERAVLERAAGDYPLKPYVGAGAVKVGREVDPFNQGSMKDALFRTQGRIGDLTAFLNAVRNRAAKVVIWSDSILEGTSQITYEDSGAALVEQYLRDQYSEVDWTFENLGIPGTGFGEANSFVYLAADPAVPGVSFNPTPGPQRNPPNYSLWPDGATLGENWSQHVRLAEPDLVILALGMNHTSTAPVDVYGALNAIVQNRILTWTHPCSIVLVTPMCPSRTAPPPAGGPAAFDRVQLHADVIRSYAEEKNLTLIDVNRIYRAYLEGHDVVQTRNSFTRGLDDFDDWVTVTTTRPADPVAGVLTFAASGSVVRPAMDRNFQLSARMALAGSEIGSMLGRAQPAAPAAQRYELAIQNGVPQVILYYGGVAVASSSLAGSASPWIVTWKSTGARHEVWVNGVKRIKVYDYKQMAGGHYGFKSAGAMTVSNFTAKGGYRRPVGFAEAPERLLLGVADDFTVDPYSQGGNAINHATALCHFNCYFAGFERFFGVIERTLAEHREPIAFEKNSATTGAIAAGNFIAISIAGTQSLPQVIYEGGTGTNLSATVATGMVEVSGPSAVVNLTVQGTTTLVTLTLTFPAPGEYLVFASGSASLSGAALRHTLSAWAFRQ